MSLLRSIVALLIGCAAVGGLSAGATARSDNLEDAIDAIRRKHQISATAYFIVAPHAVEVLQALGSTAWDVGEPFEVDHLVRIGSITKTITALAAMVLVERGDLSLEAAVRDVLAQPPYHNPWAQQRPVRVVHLLEHTAGLGDLSKKEFAFNRPVSLAEAYRVDPASRRLAWPPGLHSSYSNSGAGILSGVLEEVAGRPYEALVADEIFTPLGMSSARFVVEAGDRPNLIAGYDSDGRTPIRYWHTLYRAFGGVSVTPRDMIPFVQLFLNGGRHDDTQLVTETAVTRMQAPATTLAARAGLSYGYGLGIYQFQRRGISFYGHGGDADGYLAYFAYSPALARGYFVVINAFNKPALREMRHVLEDALVGDAGTAPPPVPALSEAHLNVLSGRYRRSTRRFAHADDGKTLEVFADGGKLYTSGEPGRRRALFAVSPWHFRRSHQTVATVAFIPCGRRLYLQGDFGNYEKPVPGSAARCPSDQP